MTTEIQNIKAGPIAWMVKHRVASNLMMLTFLIGGLISAFSIKQEHLPDFELDMVTVSVAYPGAGPEEIEQGIILSIEEAVRGLEGVEQVSSTAREGFGTVTVELLSGANEQKVYQEIRQEVDRIRTFPEESEEPSVVLVIRKREVINLALHGDVAETTLRELAEITRDHLLRSPDITQVELGGARDYEIGIEISRDRLREHDLTIPEVAGQVRRSSLELAGGGLKTEGGEILVRIQDRRDYGEEFAALPIIGAGAGGQVLLGDIAEVKDGFEDIDRFAEYNGESCIFFRIYRVGDQTPIQVATAAREIMEELNQTYPPGIKINILNDRSEMFRQRANLLLKNGFTGLVLVLILLGLFLQPRLAFWVMMGIPISFLGSFLFLPQVDVSISMISMFAFIVALGIVVDDAVVVAENIHGYIQRGTPPIQAAISGAREVASPVIFSILTNIVAFCPLLFMPGVIGKIWKVIPIVVISVFTISLIECLLVLPSHLSHKGLLGYLLGPLTRRQKVFSSWFYQIIQSHYSPFLDRVLKFRYLVVAGAIAILILVVGYVKGKRIGMELMPRVEADYAIVTAVLPYGSPVERTRVVRDKLVAAGEKVGRENGGEELIEGIYAEIGRAYHGVAGGHVVEVTCFLTDADTRPIGTGEFTRLWRQATGQIPGLQALVFESDRGGPGGGRGLTLELSHSDTEILDRAGTELAKALALFPVVSDIDDGFADGKVQIDFSLNPQGINLGLTAASVAGQVRGSFYGTEALRQQRGRNEVKVMVRLPEDERSSEYDLERLLIRTPEGIDVPLYEVAQVTRGRAYTTIERKEGRRTITVSANVTPSSEAERIVGEATRDILPGLMEKYPGLAWNFEGRQADFRESLSNLGTSFIFALLVIYLLLAIPFRNYTQPLIVMISIPFGVIGAVIGHVIMGYSLSIMSMMGIVALSGIVVNDALVLIDYINRRTAEGMAMTQAIHAAGVRRFRPILLTTLTTFGGLAPMIFETSRQARFMIPMAISLGYGILFATGITLILVPSLCLIREDIGRFFSRFRRSAGERT
ncbi:MAG: efflux RND transporter permease subunit [Candidatus Auribacterota bacterium]|nr:efflux RND transporter permease subunit [Candidatus Auribacterota bacterium]